MSSEICWLLRDILDETLINPLCFVLYRRGYRSDRIAYGAAMHNSEPIADELVAESDDLLQQHLLRIIIAKRDNHIYTI